MEGTNSYTADRGTSANHDQAQQVLQGILARSATDKAFRTKLLTDSRAAVAEFAGVDVNALPQDFRIRFLENAADATIVLPDPVTAAAELDESQLEAVSGGTGIDVWIGAALAATLIVDSLEKAYQLGQAAR